MRTFLRFALLLCLLTSIEKTQAQQRFFFDDFEKWRDWTLVDEFEIFACTGLGTTDPSAAYSGSWVLGVDLTGTGSSVGNYEPNLTKRQCAATSPVIDCRNYTGIHMKFRRWLNVDAIANDTARIEISNNGGSTWTQLWINGSSAILDASWSLQDLNISAYADGQASVLVRFSIGGTNATINYGGWNIDDFEFTGTFACSNTITTEWTDLIEAPGLTNWYQDGTDDFNWTFSSAPTPTPNTGPDAGFGGGSFAFTEGDGNLNNTASLISPCMNLSSMMNPAIEFYYHMYSGFTSDGMGNLYVDIEKVSGSGQWTTIWGKAGNHNNQWYKEVLDLKAYKNNTFRLRFRGALIWSFYTDVAIDRVKVFDNQCVMSPIVIYDTRVCPGSPSTLYFPQSDANYQWYNSPGGTLLGTGNSYNMPGQSANTTIYVQKAANTTADYLFTNYSATYNVDGVMFDIQAKNSLTIDSMEFLLSDAAGTQVPIALMIKNKTHNGNEATSSIWYTHFVDTIASPGPSTPVKIKFKGIQLNNQDTLGCYLTVTNTAYGLKYSAYSAAYYDTNMVITASEGIDYPFGTVTSNRMLNGKIYYTAHSATTQFTGTNLKSGFMMKVQAKKAIALEGIDVLTTNNSGSYTAYLYYIKGDYSGHELFSTHWFRWDSVGFVGNASYISRINFTHEFKIPEGDIISFYIGVSGTQIKNSSASMTLTNNQISVLSGSAVDYPFTGTVNSNRSLSCRIHYRPLQDATGLVPVHIMVPDIAIPTVNDTTICDGDMASLHVLGAGGIYHWLDAAIGGTEIGMGSTYTTPALPTPGTYHYYVSMEDTLYMRQLTTIQTGGGSENGVMFNITAGSEDISLDSLSFVPSTSKPASIQLYYREGSYSGYQLDPDSWHLFDRATFPILTANTAEIFNFSSGLMIPAGTTYGFYLTSQTTKLNYTAGATPYSDAYMTITPGTSNVYPFGLSTPSRTWNGTAYYTIGSSCNGLTNDVLVTVENCSGIEESAMNGSINVYPNPSHGMLSIASTGFSGNVVLELYDATALLLLTNQFDASNNSVQNLDLSNLSSGLYVLKLRGEQLNKVLKITIE